MVKNKTYHFTEPRKLRPSDIREIICNDYATCDNCILKGYCNISFLQDNADLDGVINYLLEEGIIEEDEK